jgi:uncharacterized cupin superfamily protein
VNDEPKIWHFGDDDFREVRPGMRRRIYNGGHPDNEQFGLIIAGQLDFRLGSDQRRLLGPGDVYYAPKNIPHGDSHFIGDPATGETWILDIFSPVREEYRDG